jgi:vitamin B12 transporter
LAVATGAAAPAAATAQQGSVVLLPSIYVTSPTGIPTPASKVASSVSVVTSPEIEREQRRTMHDLLTRLPGLNTVQAGGAGGQTSVFIRGTNSGHVKVLIDGIDVSDPSTPNRTFDFGHLQTFDIERVEVLRGPQSGLYGADAIGGVISVTTKKGEGPPMPRGLIEGGSFSTFNQAAGVSGSTDRIHYAFNVSHLHAGDTPVTPDRLLPPGRRAIGNYYDNTTASTRFGGRVAENLDLDVVARYTDTNLRFTGTEFPPPLFVGVPSAAHSISLNHQFFTRGVATWGLFDGRFINRFGAAYSNLWNWNDTPSPANPTTNLGTRDKYDWRGDIIVAPGQILVLGLEKENERIRTDTLRRGAGNRGAFAELQSEFADRFFFVANVRNDKHDTFGQATTWRVAPAVILPVTETKLKASYGTGFKAPSLTQLFVDFPPTFFANPNLRPEKATGYDAGFEQPLFDDRFRFGVTYFRNDITDLINCDTFCRTLINIDQATMHGAETFVAVTVSDRLQLRGDYTYTMARDARTGLQLARRPKDKYSLHAVWQPIDPLTVTSTIVWLGGWKDVDRQAVDPAPSMPGYTWVNAAANYAISPAATAFARVDNLFDVRVEDPNGLLRPGRGIYAGLRLNN